MGDNQSIEISIDSGRLEKELEHILSKLTGELDKQIEGVLKKPFEMVGKQSAKLIEELIPDLGTVGLAIGGVTLAIEGVVGIMDIWNQSVADYTEAWLKQFGVLSDAQQESIDKAAEWNKQWQEIKTRSNTEAEGVTGEYQHAQDLLGELQQITQENGKIKKGYEERAAVITNVLSQALGIEIGIVDGQITKYGELKQSLEEVIQKKQLDAMLRVYEKDYTESLKNQIAAKRELAQNEETLKQLQEEYNEVLKDKVLRSQMSSLSQEELNRLTEKYGNVITGIEPVEQALAEKMEAQRKVVEESRTTLEGMNTTVSNYEFALGAAASGGVDKMDKAVLALTGQLQLAETSNQLILEQQVADFNNAYEEARVAVENGSTEITQTDLEEKARMVLYAAEELEKWKQQHAQASQEATGQFIEHIQEGAPGSEQAAATITRAALKPIQEEFHPEGPVSERIAECASTINSRKKDVEGAMRNVASGVNAAFVVDTVTKGESITDGIKTGMRNRSGSLLSYASGLAGSIAEELGRALDINSPSKVTMRLGEYTSEGLALGIEKGEAKAIQASGNVAEESLEEMRAAFQEVQQIPMVTELIAKISAAVSAQTSGRAAYRMALSSAVGKEVAAMQRFEMLQAAGSAQPIYVETHVQLGDETELAVALTPAIEKEMAFRS